MFPFFWYLLENIQNNVSNIADPYYSEKIILISLFQPKVQGTVNYGEDCNQLVP